MKTIFLLCFFAVLGCASQTTSPVAEKNYFENTEGCFLLYNMKTQAFDKVIGGPVCRQAFPACSTFKIPLAVMAFDSGVLKDEKVVLKWDGKKDVRPESNRDHNARTWMKDSIVWFSQRLTPKLGEKRLQDYLNKFEYGNRDISAGITKAWLVSPSEDKPALKISAVEQVDFMKKLWTDTLPASKRSMLLAREITYLETSPKGFRLNGKTGSNFFDKEQKVRLGWFIGHIQSEKDEYIVVTNFHDLSPTEEKSYGGLKAKEITKQMLTDFGLW